MASQGRTAVAANERKYLRCAIYTRKSSEHGIEQDFNSLDAQREAAEAYIRSQAHEGWRCIKIHYDDGGLSGGTLDRPALQSLLDDIRSRKVDVVVVYKVDRLTRSLGDFAKLVELFEAHGGRAHPRQVRGLAAQGHVDGRHYPARIRRQGPQAHGQRRGGGPRSPDFPTIPCGRLRRETAGRPRTAWS